MHLTVVDNTQDTDLWEWVLVAQMLVQQGLMMRKEAKEMSK